MHFKQHTYTVFVT